MLIDAHTHLGTCRVFGSNQTSEALLAAMEAHEVDLSIVQPFAGAQDSSAVHDQIAELSRNHPGRFLGLANLTPHQDASAYQAEVTRCVRELGFVGVKIHTIGHAVNPGSDDARNVFVTAAGLGIPVMVHTGAGVPFAEPASWIPLARAFSETTVILAHAGGGIYSGPAIIAAEVCPNIVLETSSSNPQDIRRAAQALGADRILFGSDLVSNVGAELAKYQAVGLQEDELRGPLGDNAARVFQIS